MVKSDGTAVDALLPVERRPSVGFQPSVQAPAYGRIRQWIGRRKISQFLEDLARPHVVHDDLAAGYQAMAADTARERESLDWSDALIGDATDEARCSVVGGLRARLGR